MRLTALASGDPAARAVFFLFKQCGKLSVALGGAQGLRNHSLRNLIKVAIGSLLRVLATYPGDVCLQSSLLPMHCAQPRPQLHLGLCRPLHLQPVNMPG